MNEEETRAELIDPLLKQIGWGVVDKTRIRRNYTFTYGRLIGAGQRGEPLEADYVLVYRGKMLAVIEAKARDKPVTEGLPQAKNYAEKLGVRYTYATNGRGIYQVDMQTGKEGDVDVYPDPHTLWKMTFAEENTWRDGFAEVPFQNKGGQWKPRYYQDIAIDRALEAIAQDRQRILLTLATGTGKTAIAFQIAWKLFQSRWTLARDRQRRPRILFLADRNILADQASNEFPAFPEDAICRIKPDEVHKRGSVPTNASVFFTIFQTFMSGRDEEGNPTPYFDDYPSDFFDFIIIDECHRGGANDESNWRGIMEHFSPAVQLGLTATPKRKFNADTYAYFGEPVYVYSLKEGINDGFLTPFKVRQYATTIDEYLYTPDDDVLEGEVEEGHLYTEGEFSRKIVIPERDAYRVKLLMEAIDHTQKTIVFCATQDHAALVRDFINQAKAGSDPNYCVRVTSNDGALGEQFLRAFQDNEKTIPTILTTSRKLSTGVDALNVRNIVLMRPVNSMIEFKQIIGRGTRLYEDKDYFTIHDFVKAYHHFSDPEWDGEPIEPTAPRDKQRDDNQPEPNTDDQQDPQDDNETTKREMLRIRLSDGKERLLQSMVATSFWDPDGKPISAAQFLENLFPKLPQFFKNEDELRILWGHPDTRKTLLRNLSEIGVGDQQFKEIMPMIAAENSDIYDVLAYIAYAKPPITREQRVLDHRQTILNNYQEPLQDFINFVLDQYIKEGVNELSEEKLTNLVNAKYNSVRDAENKIGDISKIRMAFLDFQPQLYH